MQSPPVSPMRMLPSGSKGKLTVSDDMKRNKRKWNRSILKRHPSNRTNEPSLKIIAVCFVGDFFFIALLFKIIWAKWSALTLWHVNFTNDSQVQEKGGRGLLEVGATCCSFRFHVSIFFKIFFYLCRVWLTMLAHWIARGQELRWARWIGWRTVRCLHEHPSALTTNWTTSSWTTRPSPFTCPSDGCTYFWNISKAKVMAEFWYFWRIIKGYTAHLTRWATTVNWPIDVHH